MEEDKKIIGSESNINIQEENNLPLGVGLQYNEESATESAVEPFERIPNSILRSLSIRAKDTVAEIEKTYGIKITEKELKEVVDVKGNPIKLTKRQDRIIQAYATEVSIHLNDEGIKQLLEKIEKGEDTRKSFAVFDVNLEELCRKVDGPEEKWKKWRQQKMAEDLIEISKIKQIQIGNEHRKVGTDKKGKDIFEKDTYKSVDSYIGVIAEDGEYVDIGKRKVRTVRTIFGRIFLEELSNRFTPVLDSFWTLTDSKGTKINTVIFNDLYKIVANRRWSHISYNLLKTEEYIEKNKIRNTNKTEVLRNKAVTHVPIKVEKLKSLINADYTTTRKRRKDFWRELWEALRALIVYGIITTDTKIDKENETVILVYNPDFATPRQINKPISGGYWMENPFK